MKKALVLLLSLCLVFGMAACGEPAVNDNANDSAAADTSFEDIKAKGKLVIGIDDTFVPMGFRDEAGNIVGFDVDLAKAVSERMGIPFEFQKIDWKAKEMELSEKKVDCLWNGLSITEERKKVMQFTDPYLDNKLVIMSKKGAGIATKADLAGKNVGTQEDSSALDAMQADASFETYTTVEYRDYDTALMDLEIGRVDAVIIDEVMGSYKNAGMGDIFDFGTEDFGPDQYGVGFRKGDQALFEEFNKVFKEVLNDGTATAISEEWFGRDIVIK